VKKYILGKHYSKDDGTMYIGGDDQKNTYHADPKLALKFNSIQEATLFRSRLGRRREDNMREYTVHEVDGEKVTDLRR
jgi:hypothetical protein